MRILIALPGLHRYERGAEVALTAIGEGLTKRGNQVTLVGSGEGRPTESYRYLKAASIERETFERCPRMPLLRGETAYEEASFIPGLLRQYRPAEYDVTMTCAYPFTNWALRRPALGRKRPAHVFITQNGDWPAFSRKSEYRLFGCEGLVCTNPDYYERNRSRWASALIPNGIDLSRFKPGPAERERFGLPRDQRVILMVSALISTKRVEDGIRSLALLSNVHLVVAGDGPLRTQVDKLAATLLPGRFTRLTVQANDMPALYRSADAFMHLSQEESFGNVYLEAMACGLPVIAPDTTRVRWIVGDDEFLFEGATPGSVAAAAERAQTTPERGIVARVQKAANFSWERVTERYQSFLEQVVADYASGARNL